MEEHGLGVFENGPKKGEVMEDWRKLHSEELHDLYCSLNITGVPKTRGMCQVVHVAHSGEKINAYRVSDGKHEGRRPLGRSRCKWEINIRMDLKETEPETVWTGYVWPCVGTRFGHL